MFSPSPQRNLTVAQYKELRKLIGGGTILIAVVAASFLAGHQIIADPLVELWDITWPVVIGALLPALLVLRCYGFTLDSTHEALWTCAEPDLLVDLLCQRRDVGSVGNTSESSNYTQTRSEEWIRLEGEEEEAAYASFDA